MSKRAYIHRYLLIIKKLKSKPYSTYEELQTHIDNQLEYFQLQDDRLNMGFSKRTYQRDIKEIKNIFGVNIEYSKSLKGYFVNHKEIESMNFQRMMESFDLFNSLNLAEDLAPIIHLEKRKPNGTENLYGLLHAIKNKFIIKFSYEKFWDDEVSERLVQPYSLKEFKSRWYLMANDFKDGNIKSFGLDRLTNLEITKEVFKPIININIEETYRHCFGIINSFEDEPQEIILSFDPFQGKYIKSLPFHASQKILIDNVDELRIKLRLFVTRDFVMEILAHGDTVKVIQPQSLVDELKNIYRNSLNKY